MEYQQLRYEVVDPVATITLDRPDRLNALTYRMLAELRHALAAAEQDARVVGIVLTGAGRGFCAGMDMQALSGIASSAREEAGDSTTATDREATPGDPAAGPEFEVTFGYLLAVRKPLIAAVNGPCAGLGLGIAALCDLRFASDQARFTTSFSQRGLIAEHGTSWILPRLLGPARALDLLWSARRVGAEEARRLGLVDRILEPEALVAGAAEYVRELARTASPTSLQVMKRQVYRGLMQTLGEAMREANREMESSLARPDFKEGVASFLEKRPPAFGRVGH